MLQQGSINAMSHQSNVAQVSLEVYNNFFLFIYTAWLLYNYESSV